jgi:hypothetical protein
MTGRIWNAGCGARRNLIQIRSQIIRTKWEKPDSGSSGVTKVAPAPPTIKNIFARRVLTLAACKLLRRFRPHCGVVLFLSKRICVKSGYITHPSEASSMRFAAENTSIPVPKVYCSFVHNGRTYIVMERIQGEISAHVWELRSTE